jgi:hypothetical protein
MKRDDILWKAVLEDVFDDFLRFFVPNADEVFNLDHKVEYLDKELDQLFPPEGNEYKPRYVDKLAKVFTRQGVEEWVLIHVEVQGYHDDYFTKRMFQYYTRIWDKYDRSIAAFAIFTDSEASFKPSNFQQAFLGTTVSYTFNTFKIADQNSDKLAASSNPFALVVLTAKGALQGKRMTDDDLLKLKVAIAKKLFNSKLSKDKIRRMMNFLKYYVRFESEEMIDKFDKELAVIAQNDKTTMGTEEFLLDRAMKEGLERGVAKTKQEMIQKLILQGTLTPEQIAEIADVPVDFVLVLKRNIIRP